MRILSFLLCGVWIVADVVESSTHRVEADRTGDFTTIQAAVDAAVDGDVIELGNGTFTGDGNRDVIVVGKALTFRSGSGSASSCVIEADGSEGDPHRAVVLRSISTETRLENLTFAGGYASMKGSAVLAEDAPLWVVDCVFRDNTSNGVLATEEAEESSGFGGALKGTGCASVTIESCEFRDNWSGIGSAAVAMTSCDVLRVVDSSFEGNAANYEEGEGVGGVGTYQCSSVAIENCEFRRNESYFAGGAVGGSGGGTFTIRDCRFEENYNRGDRHGGGGALAFRDVTASIEDCVFRGNSTEWSGGVLAVLRVNITFSRCLMDGNRTACYGAALMCYDTSRISLIDCTLTDNGGGHEVLYNGVGSHLTLERCTLARNEGDEAVIRSWRDLLTIDHTVIAHNFAPAFGGEGPMNATWTNVYGNTGGDWTLYAEDSQGVGGNLSEDPKFCDPSADELVLAADSPCAEGRNDSRETIGAWPVGCRSAPKIATWTEVKSEFQIQ